MHFLFYKDQNNDRLQQMYKMTAGQKIYLPIKRLIGIIGSFVGIFVCLGLIWWWVFIINLFVTKGHPFFVHKRIGKNKKVFGLLKFRTMHVSADANLAPYDTTYEQQLKMETKFGSFLRKTSIDETLQLFNIFIGQMAFIGPRPGAAKNEDYLVEARESFDPNAYMVKPGLSGYAQVTLNREHNPLLKAEYDHKYVMKMSLWFDIKIFIWTIFGVFGKNKGK